MIRTFSALLCLWQFTATAADFNLYKSANGGDSWEQLPQAFPARVNAVRIAEREWLAGTDDGLFLSHNEGRTWRSAETLILRRARILVLDSSRDKVMIGTGDHGLWISSDSGNTATQATGLPMTFVRSAAHTSTHLFAGSDAGKIFTSADGGTVWTPLNKGLPSLAQIFQLESGPAGQVYAALYSKGLYQLKETGWERQGEVIPLVIAVNQTAVFAGHNPGGVFKGTQPTTNWEPVQTGLPANAPSWTIHANGETLFYGTTGVSGLYRTTNQGSSWQPVESDLLQHEGIVAIASNGSAMLAASVREKTPRKPVILDPFALNVEK